MEMGMHENEVCKWRTPSGEEGLLFDVQYFIFVPLNRVRIWNPLVATIRYTQTWVKYPPPPGFQWQGWDQFVTGLHCHLLMWLTLIRNEEFSSPRAAPRPKLLLICYQWALFILEEIWQPLRTRNGRTRKAERIKSYFQFQRHVQTGTPDRCLLVLDNPFTNPFLPVLIDFHLQLSYFPHNTPVLLPHLIKLHYNLLVI